MSFFTSCISDLTRSGGFTQTLSGVTLGMGNTVTAASTSSLSPRDTHGPLVETGPTAGQNRSRNKNGRWRKKRSDAGVPRKNDLH